MADLSQLRGLPQADGEPVFDAPWQARTFAMCLELHRRGLFSWSDWAQRLAANIAAYEQHTPIDSSDAYFELWHRTLEQLVDAHR